MLVDLTWRLDKDCKCKLYLNTEEVAIIDLPSSDLSQLITDIKYFILSLPEGNLSIQNDGELFGIIIDLYQSDSDPKTKIFWFEDYRQFNLLTN